MARTARRALIAAMAVLLDGLLVISAYTAEVRTSKERLSTKAADEQRVDNCRVPAELRGPLPRPGCANEQSTGEQTTGIAGPEKEGGSKVAPGASRR